MTENNSALKIEKTISLPMTVESHTVLVDWDNELWIMINSIQNKETFIFKMNASLSFEKMVSLPLLSTSATICKNKLIITGSNFEGKPKIISLNNLGEIQEEIILELTPTIWPVITCSNKIFFAWQEDADEIKYGSLDLEKNEIDNLPAISVNNPPAKLFPLKETIYASFSEKNKTQLVNLINNEISNLDISQPITVGETIDAIFYGWLETNSVCLKFLKKDKQINFPMKKASLGNLKAISGNEATLWIQKRELQMDDSYQWKSTIIQENTEMFEIENFIYAVKSWNDRLVLIQNSRIILLKKFSI
ncbi:MAG: hypothetical protein Q8O62_04355 [Aequorivita sp.]|nr:hypothetical protein [Aequorivita sp.]